MILLFWCVVFTGWHQKLQMKICCVYREKFIINKLSLFSIYHPSSLNHKQYWVLWLFAECRKYIFVYMRVCVKFLGPGNFFGDIFYPRLIFSLIIFPSWKNLVALVDRKELESITKKKHGRESLSFLPKYLPFREICSRFSWLWLG